MAITDTTGTNTLLSTQNLRVGRGDVIALDGVNIDVCAGEIFGIVGQARSGKTALLETLIGMRPPLAGTVSLMGRPNPPSIEVRQRLGSSLRPSTVERRTTVDEAVRLCASLYDHHADVDAIVQEVGLAGRRSTYREKLAPHELARLSLAMGLVSNPAVLFADEPTRELDPAGRHEVWDLLRRRRAGGMAIVLATNMMDEAERLCDRVAILGNRRVLAVDTPDALVAGGDAPGRLVIDFGVAVDRDALLGLAGVGKVTIEGTVARLVTMDPVVALAAVSRLLNEKALPLRSLRLAQATLEDRFVELMGSSAAPAAGAGR